MRLALARLRTGATYSRLPGDTSWDNNNICARQHLLQAVIWGKVADDLCWGRDVGQICRDSGSVDDIVQPQLYQVIVKFVTRIA